MRVGLCRNEGLRGSGCALQQFLEPVFPRLTTKPRGPALPRIQKGDFDRDLGEFCMALCRKESIELGRNKFPFIQSLKRKQEKKMTLPDGTSVAFDYTLRISCKHLSRCEVQGAETEARDTKV